MSTSLSRGKPDRSALLAKVLDAHGGLENWERVRSLRADIVLGGPFWSMLGWADGELELTASLDARREHITLGRFIDTGLDRGLRCRAAAAVDPSHRRGARRAARRSALIVPAVRSRNHPLGSDPGGVLPERRALELPDPAV